MKEIYNYICARALADIDELIRIDPNNTDLHVIRCTLADIKRDRFHPSVLRRLGAPAEPRDIVEAPERSEGAKKGYIKDGTNYEYFYDTDGGPSFANVAGALGYKIGATQEIPLPQTTPPVSGTVTKIDHDKKTVTINLEVPTSRVPSNRVPSATLDPGGLDFRGKWKLQNGLNAEVWGRSDSDFWTGRIFDSIEGRLYSWDDNGNAQSPAYSLKEREREGARHR